MSSYERMPLMEGFANNHQYHATSNRAVSPGGRWEGERRKRSGTIDEFYVGNSKEGGDSKALKAAAVRTGRQRKRFAARTKGGEFQARRRKRRIYFCCISNDIDVEKLADEFGDTYPSFGMQASMYDEVLHLYKDWAGMERTRPLDPDPQRGRLEVSTKTQPPEVEELGPPVLNSGSYSWFGSVKEEEEEVYVSHEIGIKFERLDSLEESSYRHADRHAYGYGMDGDREEMGGGMGMGMGMGSREGMDRDNGDVDSSTEQEAAGERPRSYLYSYDNVISDSEDVRGGGRAKAVEKLGGLCIPDATEGKAAEREAQGGMEGEGVEGEEDVGPFADQGKEVFVYGFGAAVFWGMQKAEVQELLAHIEKYIVKGPLSQEEFERGEDDMAFVTSFESAEISIANDVISLPPHASVKQRLAVGFAIAQSAVLSIFEARVEQKIEEYKYIPETLARSGKVHLTPKQLGIMIGEVFVMQHDVNLHSEILDLPDYFWKEKVVEPLYRMFTGYMEMEPRIEVLNKRLDLLRQLLHVLQQQHENAHSVKLEWIVIWLIVVSCVLEGWDIVKDFLGWS